SRCDLTTWLDSLWRPVVWLVDCERPGQTGQSTTARYRVHDLRHTCATLPLHEGAIRREIMELLDTTLPARLTSSMDVRQDRRAPSGPPAWSTKGSGSYLLSPRTGGL